MLMGHFHVPKCEMTQCFVCFPTQPAGVSVKKLKSFGTAEFTSELKNAFYCLNTASLVLQMPNTGKRQNVKKYIHVHRSAEYGAGWKIPIVITLH